MFLEKKFQIILLLILFSISNIYATQLRIMPLGDSVTYDNTHADDEGSPRPIGERHAYRNYLWYKLQDANKSVDFVGSRHAGQSITPPFDIDNEGYPGETSNEIAARTYGILQKNPPDAILLHVGSNDHSDDISGVNKILDWIDTYENDSNHPIRVFVALIIDRKVHDLHIEKFNQNLEKLVMKRWQNGDILTLVDMYTGAKLNDNDYVDVTHPNDRGYNKIANVWFDALNKPYKAFTSAPITKDDKINAQTGVAVSINVLANDKDFQNNMDKSTVNFIGGADTDNDGDNDKLTIPGEGVWHTDELGIVTFIPENGFTSDPTPINYTVSDTDKEGSKPAKITVNYTNASLENYPTSLVDAVYIESTSINEATNTIEFITRVPNSGISF